MIIIDGEGSIFGRVLSKAAKLLLKGEEVKIYNAEKMVITGNRDATVAKYARRLSFRDPAKPEHSPKLPRKPDLFAKRVIRNMLPKKSARGREAYKRVKFFIGGTKERTVKMFPLEKDIKFMTLEQLCKELGWKG